MILQPAAAGDEATVTEPTKPEKNIIAKAIFGMAHLKLMTLTSPYVYIRRNRQASQEGDEFGQLLPALREPIG